MENPLRVGPERVHTTWLQHPLGWQPPKYDPEGTPFRRVTLDDEGLWRKYIGDGGREGGTRDWEWRREARYIDGVDVERERERERE